MSRAAHHLRRFWRSAARTLTRRVRAGVPRTRRSIIPALQMTVAGVGAYLLAENLLGHSAPIFAAVAALLATGFNKEPRVRKVLEVAVGCTLGVLIGDLLVHAFGAGIPTAVVVVFFSVMLARFLDPGPTFAMQMGLQALLVVMLPAPEETTLGPFARSADAVIGGVTALLIALLTPKDPRHEPVRELKAVAEELTRALRETAAAVRNSDSREAWHALIRSRGIQSKIDDAGKALDAARELTRYSPTHRRHRQYIRSLEGTADKLDLAVRSLRIVTRRSIGVIDRAALTDDGMNALARVLDELADASVQLARAVAQSGPGFDRSMETARDAVGGVAAQLHPGKLGIDAMEGETEVLLLRTMAVDLLEATGLDHSDAVDFLPTL